jgi:hypothetical protein
VTAKILTHQRNIQRYGRLLATQLTEVERQYLHKRIAEEQAKLERLAVQKSPPALPAQADIDANVVARRGGPRSGGPLLALAVTATLAAASLAHSNPCIGCKEGAQMTDRERIKAAREKFELEMKRDTKRPWDGMDLHRQFAPLPPTSVDQQDPTKEQ